TSSCMASSLLLRLDAGTNDHIAPRSARTRAFDRDEMTIEIDLHDFEIDRGAAHRTHVTGHLLAREHAARRLALADRARRTMRQRVAVRRVAHREMVALDRALETLALGDAGDVDFLSDREDLVGLQLAADRELADLAVVETEFPKTATAFDLRLRVVSG